jgi:deoxyribose-phosphate aldolase
MNDTLTTPEPSPAERHLAKIAATQRQITDTELEIDIIHRQKALKQREMLGYVKELRDLVEQAAGLQALALPFEGA